MNIFRLSDYRDVIAAKIEDSKKMETKLSFSELADAIQVQKAYITRVLKKDGHLNTDQLYLTCEYFSFNPEETKYMGLLLEFNRSILPARRKELQRQISDIQAIHRDTRKHLKAQIISPLNLDEYNRYYLDPLAPLVHTFLSIPTFAKSIKAIAAKLNISEKRIKTTIQTLESLKIIKWNSVGGSYQVLRDHMQLAGDSPLNLPYQVFQRTNALHKIQTQSLEDRFVFSVAFSADEKGKTEIHEEFLKFLKKAETVVRDSQPSDIYQMNFDLFGWN